MNTSRILAPVILLGWLVSGGLGAQTTLKPGQEGRLDVPGCDYPCVIYIPSDYRRGLKLPLIFFLHGAGAKPTTWPWRPATEGEGHIVVGLSYGAVPDGASRGIPQDDRTCVAMIEFIEKVRTLVDGTYGIDQRRVFLTGLSMGGWGTNRYGFHTKARGRYRGYCIMAAGIARGGPALDLSVLEDKPLLLLNGATDANLPAANAGKPRFEEAGAIVTQVVIPNQGHVPSIQSMTPHLAEWLENVEKSSARGDGVAAVTWQHVMLEGAPPRGGSRSEALLAWFKKQAFLAGADAARPALVFCTVNQTGAKGKPTAGTKASIQCDRELFHYPGATETPAAVRGFRCFRVDLTEVSKKANPFLNRATAPVVVLLDRGRSSATLLNRGKLRDKLLAAQLKKLLDAEEIAAADKRLAAAAPLTKELRQVMDSLEKQRKALAALRRRPGKAAQKKIETLTAKLVELETRFDELREQLRK